VCVCVCVCVDGWGLECRAHAILQLLDAGFRVATPVSIRLCGAGMAAENPVFLTIDPPKISFRPLRTNVAAVVTARGRGYVMSLPYTFAFHRYIGPTSVPLLGNLLSSSSFVKSSAARCKH
jgi:hypothetical protein